MKRKFVKHPVMASTYAFWSTEVESFEDIKAEIQKALDAGTTFEDVDDYLNELYNLEIIDDEQFSELINWAAPLTSNSDVYCAQDAVSSDVVKFEVGQTYTCSGLYGGQIKYTIVDRTDNSVALAESHVSEDDWSNVDDGVKEYPIVIQDMYDDGYENVIGKQESVVIWEYSGHEGYLYATNSSNASDDSIQVDEDEWDESQETAFEHYDRNYAREQARFADSTNAKYRP